MIVHSLQMAPLAILRICGVSFAVGCIRSDVCNKITSKAVETLERPLLEVIPDENLLLRLKKRKFKATLSGVKEQYKLYQYGLTQLSDLMKVGQHMLRAQVGPYDKSQARVQIWSGRSQKG